MPKTVTPLTNTQVERSTAKDKDYYLSDGEGLQLRISTNGKKNWVLKYSVPITKKRTNISLGHYPAVSLKEARRKRSEAKELLAK
jgi:hypothetical protein